MITKLDIFETPRGWMLRGVPYSSAALALIEARKLNRANMSKGLAIAQVDWHTTTEIGALVVRSLIPDRPSIT